MHIDVGIDSNCMGGLNIGCPDSSCFGSGSAVVVAAAVGVDC